MLHVLALAVELAAAAFAILFMSGAAFGSVLVVVLELKLGARIAERLRAAGKVAKAARDMGKAQGGVS